MRGAEPATRSSQLLSYVDRLRATGELDRVLAQLAPETWLLLKHPPVAPDWIPLQHNVNLFVAVEATLGLERVRTLAHEVTRDALSVNLRPVFELALGAFGASPGTLMTHAETLLRFRTRGQEIGYVASGPRSGVLEIVVHGLAPPRAFFEAWAGREPGRGDAAGGIGVFELAWE